MLNEAQKVTVIGGIVNFLLALVKIIFGTLGGSAAIVADGVHSLSDLISDGLVFWVASHSHKAPDAEHPYGHQKFETMATLGLGVILVGVGLGIMFDAIVHFNEPANITYSELLLAVSVLSIVSKEAMYWLTLRVGKRTNSKMIIANAWHHRLDALTSIVVLVGLIGALNGYPMLDKIAAILVSFMIFHISWELVSESVSELVETAIDPKEVNELRTAIMAVSGVVDLHELRTRRIGGNIISDIHVQVEPRLTVSEGHSIALTVEHVAKSANPNLSEVMIHIDPEDDETARIYQDFPNRAQALGQINTALFEAKCKCDKDIIDIKLHYLNGKIEVDFYLSLACISTENTTVNIRTTLTELLQIYPHFGDIRVYFSEQ